MRAFMIRALTAIPMPRHGRRTPRPRNAAGLPSR
jgi:hypothetical protein